MKLEEVKNTAFPRATMEDWSTKAEESLKGRSIESLSKRTYENIQLKPLYSREDIDVSRLSGYPGQADFRRGIHASGYQGRSWHVANRIDYASLEDLEEKAKKAFSSGQTALAFEADAKLFGDEERLCRVIADYSNKGPLSIIANGFLDTFIRAAAKGAGGAESMVTGFIAADPVAEAAGAGGFPKGEKDVFAEWEQTLRFADTSFPEVKTILVNVIPYHNAGANAVQELGVALATGVFYIQSLLDNGWDLEKALGKLVFHFSIGGNFFMETSKLRAARLLWNKVAEAYGADRESGKMTISAETSFFTKTVFDPYVNLLRAGNEAFAAVLGGIQYLSVSPLDIASGRSTAFSERIARNTQLILKAEAHLERVADPSGGSWYIESVTQELAEKAWDYFLQIEEQEGVLAALKSNWLQEDISKVRAKRDKDVFLRKQSIIGTNVYANAAEQAKAEHVEVEESKTAFKPLPAGRLSQPYEKLRFKAAAMEEKTGLKPAVGLICLGNLKQHKSRMDFITGFLASGGIGTQKSPDVEKAETAYDFIETSKLKHFCLCGDNQQYSQMAVELAKEISVRYPEVSVALAGYPGMEDRQALTQCGIKNFYHMKSSQFESLSHLLNEMEVANHGQKA
jgi:methylmalonyl-CoA mutase